VQRVGYGEIGRGQLFEKKVTGGDRVQEQEEGGLQQWRMYASSRRTQGCSETELSSRY